MSYQEVLVSYQNKTLKHLSNYQAFFTCSTMLSNKPIQYLLYYKIYCIQSCTILTTVVELVGTNISYTKFIHCVMANTFVHTLRAYTGFFMQLFTESKEMLILNTYILYIPLSKLYYSQFIGAFKYHMYLYVCISALYINHI